MSDIGKTALKTKIDNKVYENSSQAITGTIMNEILQDVVDTLADGGNLDAGSVNTANIADGAVTDAKLQNPVSVSQNSQTGHTDINIGGNSYPVASVEEVGQLGQQVNDITNSIVFVNTDWKSGKVYSKYGILVDTPSSFKYTDIIDIRKYKSVDISVYLLNTTGIVLFNKEKVKVDIITGISSSDFLHIERTISVDDYGFIAVCSYYDEENGYIPTIKYNGIKENRTNLNELFEHIEGTNFINEWYDNFYIDGGTYQGKLFSYSGFFVTKPIKLKQNVPYYYNSLFNKYYAFFDADMNFISGAGNNPLDAPLANPFTIPEGAVYGCFQVLSASAKDTAWINKENIQPPTFKYDATKLITDKNCISPIDYEGNEIRMFMMGIACGDSLTEGTFNTENSFINHQQYSYPYFFYKKTNVYLRNFGVGGTTAQSWYERYENVQFPVYDFAIIAFGVNDLLQGVSPSVTVQYLGNIVNKLKSANADVRCFVATVNRAYITDGDYSDENWNAMNDAIRTFVASNNNCYLLDIATYGITETDTPYVNGHLTALGYNELAREYANMISFNIKNNLNDFDSVQFSGTDKIFIEEDLRDLLRILQ